MYGKNQPEADFKKLNDVSPEREFKKLIEKTEYDCMEKGLPFCRACAWGAFNNELRVMRDHKINQFGFCLDSDADCIKLAQEFDMSKYIGESKFNLKKTSPAREQRTIDGSKLTMQIGWHLNYECKNIDLHHCTVFLTMSEYEKKKTADGKKSKKSVSNEGSSEE